MPGHMQLVARRQFLGLGLAPLAAAVFHQPEPGAPLLPFLELDHVSIRVSDVRRSAQFYMRLFGSDAARDMNRQANPGSQPGELWFIRLGRSHLALAPSFAKETPGIDHYCLSISGFSKATAQATLARFPQPFPEWPSNNVWLEDPDGLLVQLAPSANEPQIPGIVRNAAPVPRSADLPETPPFQAIRISQLSLATGRAAAARSYYRR
jgi:catechol 2,3-dioxygenase-like lactoylglutathione lyase family enzyme